MSEAVKISNAMLKEVLTDALVLRGNNITDANTIKETGWFFLNTTAETMNYPLDSKHGFMMSMKYGSIVAQMFIQVKDSGVSAKPRIFFRANWSQGDVWGVWVEASTTEVLT